MQVSWIDPNEIRDLLAQLEGPPPKPAVIPSEWEVHNLGIVPAPEAPSILQTPPVAERPAQVAAPVTPAPSSESRPAPVGMDLDRIRERLQALRTQAREAGMLPRVETASAIAPAPVTAAPVRPVAELPAVPELPQPAAATNPSYEPLFGATAAPVVRRLTVPLQPAAPPVVPALPVMPPDAPPFVVPALGLSDRLNAFALWARERLKTTEVLLVDDYGDVLWGGHAQTPLALSAMMAWQAAQRSSASRFSAA